MQISGVASNYTLIPAGQTAALVADGASIIVYGIVASSTSNSNTNILEADGVTPIMTIRVVANSAVESRTHFIASNGVSVTTTSTAQCLVFHSAPGA